MDAVVLLHIASKLINGVLHGEQGCIKGAVAAACLDIRLQGPVLREAIVHLLRGGAVGATGGARARKPASRKRG